MCEGLPPAMTHVSDFPQHYEWSGLDDASAWHYWEPCKRHLWPLYIQSPYMQRYCEPSLGSWRATLAIICFPFSLLQSTEQSYIPYILKHHCLSWPLPESLTYKDVTRLQVSMQHGGLACV